MYINESEAKCVFKKIEKKEIHSPEYFFHTSMYICMQYKFTIGTIITKLIHMSV